MERWKASFVKKLRGPISTYPSYPSQRVNEHSKKDINNVERIYVWKWKRVVFQKILIKGFKIESVKISW